MARIKFFKILLISLAATAVIVGLKWLLHYFSLEPIEQTSLHNSVVSSVIFVVGFLLTATIADYKESEKIPAEFAALVEDMYEDAKTIYLMYPKFSLDTFQKNLIDILEAFRDGTREQRHSARREISELHATFYEMEKAGVPANFIVKLKQQQGQLLKSLFRINYIQRIKFIPSAFILMRAIVGLVIIMLLLTNVDPFYGSLVLCGIISFILIYMQLLIQTISVPFHKAGSTKDDVSLFLLREVKANILKK